MQMEESIYVGGFDPRRAWAWDCWGSLSSCVYHACIVSFSVDNAQKKRRLGPEKSNTEMMDCTNERKTPDTPTRLKATELLGKFRGYLIERHEVKTDGEITFSITPATPAQRKGPTRIEMDGWQSGEEK